MRLPLIILLTILISSGVATAQDTRLDELLLLVRTLEARIDALEDENAELREALHRIELQLGTSAAPSGSPVAVPTANNEMPVLIVEETRLYDPGVERAELKSTLGEITKLEGALKTATASLDAYRRGATRISESEASAIQGRISGYRRDLRTLRAQAARMEKEVEVTRYWVLGWDGQKDVMLLTTRDESSLLSTIGPGDLLHWVGEIVEAGIVGSTGANYQTVVVRGILAGDQSTIAPQARPAGRDPVWKPVKRAFGPPVEVFPRLPRP